MVCSIRSLGLHGVSGYPVSAECDLSGGLPAEIEARQRQYEYYRDKLLTFTENTD